MSRRRVRRAPLCAVLSVLALLGTACATPEPRRHSVLLISADSLRVDRLRLWHDAGVATPRLEALAARGTRYENAWAVSPWTAPSMVSVMTGLYPPSHGAVYRDDVVPPFLPTLPRILAGEGYRRGNFSFFSEISYFRNLGLGSAVDGLRHATVARSFRHWLAALPPEEPFFAWVHLLEPHLPYGAGGYRAREVSVAGSSGLEKAQLEATVPLGTAAFAAGDRARLLELYDRDVAAMDVTLGRLLHALEKHGRTASTIVVFVADHGEELLEYGWVGHASTAIEARLVPEIMRIPLIFAGPEVPAGVVRDELARQVDVLPTVLRLLRLPSPEPLDGAPLPGLGGRSWPWSRPVFFDSAPGGNLTPRERRGERLQGVSDGRCLAIRHLGAAADAAPPISRHPEPAACTPGRLRRLERALARFQERQTRQRLAILAASPERAPPAAVEIERYAETLEVVAPVDGAVLRWGEAQGQLALEWRGRGEAGGDGEAGDDGEESAEGYWLEYRLRGVAAPVNGVFPLEQRRVVFGPVPPGFWNDLAGYGPYRIRVVDAGRRLRSPWVVFELAPAG